MEPLFPPEQRGCLLAGFRSYRKFCALRREAVWDPDGVGGSQPGREALSLPKESLVACQDAGEQN